MSPLGYEEHGGDYGGPLPPSLPPVVADPTLCAEAPWQRWDLDDPHLWDSGGWPDPIHGEYVEIKLCRFCGGRKP